MLGHVCSHKVVEDHVSDHRQTEGATMHEILFTTFTLERKSIGFCIRVLTATVSTSPLPSKGLRPSVKFRKLCLTVGQPWNSFKAVSMQFSGQIFLISPSGSALQLGIVWMWSTRYLIPTNYSEHTYRFFQMPVMVLTNSWYTSSGRFSLANSKHCIVSSMYSFFPSLYPKLSSSASLGDAIFFHCC